MKKVLLFIITILPLFAEKTSLIDGISNIRKPIISPIIIEQFGYYMKDKNIDAFVCGNKYDRNIVIPKSDVRLLYTNRDYYIYNSNLECFKISSCEPAGFVK